METTLNKIRQHSPDEDGWKKLLSYLGKTKADDEPLPILTILESNGLDDALWALRCVEGHDREIRLIACEFAESLPPEEKRHRHTIEAARRFSNDNAAWTAVIYIHIAFRSAEVTDRQKQEKILREYLK